LAVIAVPKFINLTTHAKEASVKTIVNSVQDSLENIHSKWLVNEDFVWVGADGVNHSADFNNTTGYPLKLDEGAGESELFKYVLKVPINACASSESFNCWDEYQDKKYEYKFSADEKICLEYNDTAGLLECIDDSGCESKTKCEKVIY